MTTNEEVTEEQSNEATEQIQLWFNVVRQVLMSRFPEHEVAGQIAEHSRYGHLFAYQLTQGERVYAVGFFLNELVEKFQNYPDPSLWLASFYYDKMDSGESSLLPAQPDSEEEAKQVIDGIILPMCAQSIREEFPDEEIVMNLELHPDHGPILEASLVRVKEGNNTCAVPIMFLLAMYLLNRDPSEAVTQALQLLVETNPV